MLWLQIDTLAGGVELGPGATSGLNMAVVSGNGKLTQLYLSPKCLYSNLVYASAQTRQEVWLIPLAIWHIILSNAYVHNDIIRTYAYKYYYMPMCMILLYANVYDIIICICV